MYTSGFIALKNAQYTNFNSFNKKRIFIVECIVCGNTKEMQYAEFIRQKNIHSVKNCKMNYMNKEVGKQYVDFIV